VLVSTHDLAALPRLAERSILLATRVLMHAPTAEVLRPENLARAFGLDPAEGAA
jgi:manganese transport system ATP-binding protein